MIGRIPGSIALAAFVLWTAASARADDTPAAAPSAAPAASAAPATSAAPAADAPPAASASASATPKSSGVVTGYAYREHGPTRATDDAPRHHARIVHHANEAVAKTSGFEMLAGGGSRLFVQLSRQVDVDQSRDAVGGDGPRHARHGKGAKQAPRASMTRLTYVLKGTELARANDGNALETMHFNTPVVRARLKSAGRDLRFEILMRADVTPTMKIVAAKDNGAVLQIDFPQGSYVTPGADGATNEAPGDANGSGNGDATEPPQQ